MENWSERHRGQQPTLFFYSCSKGAELPTSYASPFPRVHFVLQPTLPHSSLSPLSNPCHLQKAQIPSQSAFSQAEQAPYPLTMFSSSSVPLLACLRLSRAQVSVSGHNHCLGMQLHGEWLPKPWKGQRGRLHGSLGIHFQQEVFKGSFGDAVPRTPMGDFKSNPLAWEVYKTLSNWSHTGRSI